MDSREVCQGVGLLRIRKPIPTHTTMKESLRSIIRHLLVPLAGLGGFLVSKNLIGPEDVEAANAAGAGMIEVISAVVVGLVMWAIVKFFPNKITNDGVGKHDEDGPSPSGGIGTLPLGILLLCALALLFLPSCGTGLSGMLSYRDVESGAKGGLVFDGDGPSGFVRVPIYDEGGKLVGEANLRGELAGEIEATK